jgi:hypothetical protein
MLIKIIKILPMILATSVLFTNFLIPVKSSLAEPPKDAKLIAEHLDFFGFQSKITEDYLLAESSKYISIYMHQMDIGLNLNIAFTVNQNAIKNRGKLTELLNNINAKAIVIKLYVDENSDLVIEAVYTGDYNKKEFGSFIQTYLADYELVYENWEELNQYLHD